MEILWQELSFGFGGKDEIVRVLFRLIASFILGGLIGLEREKFNKPAGLRTHILVSLGTTVFVLGIVSAGMAADELSRVIQGIITGIGFIGAGAILKSDVKYNVKGLTSAAGIWITSAIGVVVGLGEVGLAMITTVLTLIVLSVVTSVEKMIEDKSKNNIKKSETIKSIPDIS